MRKYAHYSMGLLAVVLSLAFLAPQRAMADDDDPPGRVARLGYTQGSVSFEPAGTEDWVSAVVNRPLTTGDRLWNDNDSLSELRLGNSAIRLGSNTGISFLNLTDNMVQVSLTEGTLNIRVRRLDDDETFEVDTPNLAFTLLRPGNYKINVNESGDATIVLVRQGQGEITGGGNAYAIHPREVGSFTGTDQLEADVQGWDNSSDDFDNWCSERESRVDNSISARYVSDEVIGYEDLDENGSWRSVSEYGEVWFPHVTIAGWAPYHYGHWAYIAPWGYTWVDDASWGFAPFHYGRWVVVGGVWGWVPAPPRSAFVETAYVRPVYAPALVAWVGGPHFAIGVGIGGATSVGWFPLGPREVYVPSYHVSRTYVTNINISNTHVERTVVNNYYETTVVRREVTRVNYVNQRVPGAVMATTSVAFTSAQPVARHVVVVNTREVVSAPVRYGAPAVAPSREAVLGAGVMVRARPREVVEHRTVVVRNAPPPPPPSFERQQRAIQANGGRPLAVSQIRQIQPETVQVHSNIRIAPKAQVQNVQVDRGERNSNRNFQRNTGRPVAPADSVNRSGAPPMTAPHERAYTDRPENNRPVASPNSVNQSGAPPMTAPHERAYTDRPASSRPVAPGDSVNQSGAPPMTAPRERAYTDRPENNRPVAPPSSVNQSGAPPMTAPHERAYTDRPENNRPVASPNSVNQSGAPPMTAPHERVETDRPVNSRPISPANTDNAPHPAGQNPQVEQQPRQDVQAPRDQRNEERPKFEQQRQQQQNRSVLPQRNAADKEPVRVNQQRPPQPEQTERKQRFEPQRANQQQQVEKKKDQKPSKPAKEEKPQKNDK